MTEAEWGYLAQYVRARADELGLRDWVIVVTREAPKDDDAAAEISPIEGQKTALLRLPADFRTVEPDKQCKYLAHELIHCHFAEASDVIRMTLWDERLLAHSTYVTIWSVFRRAMEYGIDGLAVEIGGKFPPIEWPGETS